MDMTLYALLMNMLNGKDECSTWNGFKIEVVDEIPTSQVPNTIYFVVKSTISLSKERIVDENGNNIVDENGNNIVDENGNYIVGSDS